MTGSVEYRLLGSLEVVAGGGVHEINSARQRVLLTMLLLHANQVVPVDLLIDAMWNDNPPVTAKSQLQTCVSVLRRQLSVIGAKSEIATRSIGYMIVISDDSLDIETFNRLVASGRAAAADDRADEAVDNLRAALALWRGPAAAGEDSALAQAMATRLNENRVAVLEECIDLELELGRHRDLTGELGELVKQYPLREKLRAQHMLCLYRSARQADALESFREARDILKEELGLDPGQDLRRLEQAILANDQALDLEPAARRGPVGGGSGAPVVPCQLPAAIADFTGRRELLQTLTGLLAAEPGPDEPKYLPVVALTGKSGVGKTALSLQVAHAVRQQYPDGQLYAQLREPDGQPVRVAALLERFLRALGLPPSALPNGLAERTAVYRTALADRRVLIVLDDADSVNQVLPLIPGTAACAVVITSRYPLSGLHGAHHFEVTDLDEQTSVELLARIIGPDRVQAEQASAMAIVRLCGYLPLALRIVGAKLATRTHWRLDKMVRRMTNDDRRLDELALGGIGIRATLMLSCNGLSRRARQLFLRLSLLGTADFAAWVSAPLLDLDAGTAADVLDTLIEARMVEVQVSEDGSPRFRLHELVRIYALELLTAEEPIAERLHALERLLRCWLSLAAEAHRRSYGGDYAVLHGTAPRWPLPGEVVDELLESPMNWFRTEHAGLVSAIMQAAQAGYDELCWDLAVTSVTLFESEHHVDDWQKTHEAALNVTRQMSNARGEAAVLCSLGNLCVGMRPEAAERYLEAALAIFKRIGDTHGRAMALGLLAYADRQTGRYDQALARYLDALDSFRAVGDLVSEVDALASIAQIKIDCGCPETAKRYLDEALTICRSLKGTRVAAQTEHRLGEFYLHKGDLDRAEQTFRSVLDMVRNEHDLIGEIYALIGLGTVHSRQGARDLAEADLQAALSLSRRVGDNIAHGRILLALAEFYMANEAPERAVSLVNEAFMVFREIGPAKVLRDQFLELRSRLDEQIGFGPGAAGARG